MGFAGSVLVVFQQKLTQKADCFPTESGSDKGHIGIVFYLCPMQKPSKAYLSKLEDLVSEGGFMVRYERGNFKSGYCVLKENKLILINNFLPLEGRINCMIDLVRTLPLDEAALSEKNRKLRHDLLAPVQTSIVFSS
jgi:hypothetical protein